RGMRADVFADLRRREHGDRSFVRADRSAHRAGTGGPVAMPRRNPSLAIGASLVAILLVVGTLGPSLTHDDPLTINLPLALAGPMRGHPLGCDALGRDILARLLHGARISLAVSISVVALSLIAGSLIGGSAALLGGRIDSFA